MKPVIVRLFGAAATALLISLTGCVKNSQDPDSSDPGNSENGNTSQVEQVLIGDGTLLEFDLLVGGPTRILTATVSPKSYQNPVVEWTASPEGVVELRTSANTLECTVTATAEGKATITASCGGKSASVVVNCYIEDDVKGVKAAYEDFLGNWYVSGTLGIYFQQWHEIPPYDMKYIINVRKDAAGTGYLISGWETPATVEDARNAYYSCLNVDKNGEYLTDIYSYFTSRFLDMDLEAGYDSESGYMYLTSQIKYENSSKSQTVVLSVSHGVIGNHTFTNPTTGARIADFWKQPDGTVSVLYPEGDTRATAMGYMNLDGSMYYLVANVIYNNLPDFPLVMTKAERIAESVSINNAGTLETGQTIKVTATLSPETADISHLGWYSTDPSVATVDASGNLTAVHSGTTTIVAYADGKWAKRTVTVL